MTNNTNKIARKKAFERKMLRRRITFYTISAVLITALFIALYSLNTTNTKDFTWEKHTVTESSLWEIAEDLNLNMDTREVVDLIEERNGIDASNLQSYQVIEVPSVK